MKYIIRIIHRDEMLQVDNRKTGDSLLCISTKDPAKAMTWTDRALADEHCEDLQERGIRCEVMTLDEFVNGV